MNVEFGFTSLSSICLVSICLFCFAVLHHDKGATSLYVNNLHINDE